MSLRDELRGTELEKNLITPVAEDAPTPGPPPSATVMPLLSRNAAELASGGGSEKTANANHDDDERDDEPTPAHTIDGDVALSTSERIQMALSVRKTKKNKQIALI